jgi:hypothetical protein
MVQEHKAFHRTSKEEEKKASDSYSDSKIILDVHIVGGFDDKKGSSREISNWLITLLASIAAEEKDSLVITLQTCAISSMNDDGRNSPIGRGLAMNMKTGDTLDATNSRWTFNPFAIGQVAVSCPLRLHLIHTYSNTFCIEPFAYAPFKELASLLNLPDDVLLKYTSTSPDCEEDDFCRCIRSTLKFLRDVPCQRIFGAKCDRALLFQRIRHSNSWKLA